MENSKQHKVLTSILLHLFPGVIVLIEIFVFSDPYFSNLIGVDEKLSPIVGYLSSILFGLLPLQLGLLLLAGKRQTGKFSLRGIIGYTEKSKIKEYFVYVPILLLFFAMMFMVVAPLIQPYIIQTFFEWWPEEYNFQLLLQNPSALAGYQGIKLLVIAYILLSCILGPLTEELYFRGYLLPGMQNYAGKWAPFLNTVLFSIYHFFSPWENLIRIITSYPLVYTVWKKRDIRYGILVHILINSIGGVIALSIISSQ